MFKYLSVISLKPVLHHVCPSHTVQGEMEQGGGYSGKMQIYSGKRNRCTISSMLRFVPRKLFGMRNEWDEVFASYMITLL